MNAEYNSDRDHEEILDKIADGQMSLPFKEQGDVVKAQLLCLQGGYDFVKVKVRLTIEPYKPTPENLSLNQTEQYRNDDVVRRIVFFVKRM